MLPPFCFGDLVVVGFGVVVGWAGVYGQVGVGVYGLWGCGFCGLVDQRGNVSRVLMRFLPIYLI